jgi:hypothetical protein
MIFSAWINRRTKQYVLEINLDSVTTGGISTENIITAEEESTEIPAGGSTETPARRA